MESRGRKVIDWTSRIGAGGVLAYVGGLTLWQDVASPLGQRHPRGWAGWLRGNLTARTRADFAG